MRMKKHFTIRAVWDGVRDAFGKFCSVTDSGLGGFDEWKNHAIYEEEKALDWIKQRIKRVEHYHQTFEDTRITREITVSYTHLRAHETDSYLVCRLLLEKK